MRVTAAHLVGAGGVYSYKMIPVAPAVNSSIKDSVTPWSGACGAQSGKQPSAQVMQRNRRFVQMHSSASRESCLASPACRA